MANSAIIFNIAKGSVAEYARLPGTGDTLTWVLLSAAGLEADVSLVDYTNLGAGAGGLTAANNVIATFTGYAPQVATSITITPDNTNNWVDVDCADPQWTSTTAEALGKIVLAYDPDGTLTLASMIPLFADSFLVTTPVGGPVDYVVGTSGFFRAV